MSETNRNFLLRAFVAAAAAGAVISPAFASPERDHRGREYHLEYNRIVGGVEAQPGHFPYFVDYGCCGGALIAPDIVLTAAHCDVEECEVRTSDYYIGAYVWQSSAEGAQVRSCETWVNDPKFDDELGNYDFALVKLNETVDIDESLVVLELNELNSFPSVGSDVIAIGLGATNVMDPLIDDTLYPIWSDVLMNVTIPTISNAECEKTWDPLGDDFLCTLFAEGGKDACVGDSGGPLVVRDYLGDGTFKDIHVGMVSFAWGCALPNEPAVHARTSANIDWIKTTACDELGSVASFCKSPTKSSKKKSKSSKKTKSPKKTKAPKS